MSNKILKITEKVPKDAFLPDGKYTGVHGGYHIEVKYLGKTYDLETEEGVRGANFKVLVTIKDGVATFEDLTN